MSEEYILQCKDKIIEYALQIARLDSMNACLNDDEVVEFMGVKDAEERAKAFLQLLNHEAKCLLLHMTNV